MKHLTAWLVIVASLTLGVMEKKLSATTVSPQYIIIDDYNGVSFPGREWYYSCIDTDRGAMGYPSGAYTVNTGGGTASVTVTSGWGGVWTSLLYNAVLKAELNPAQLLGPYVKSQYQPKITGIEVDVVSGTGKFKIELKNKNDVIITQQFYQLTGGQKTLTLTIPDHVTNATISKLNWLVDGPGQATIDEVRFVIDSPQYPIAEAVFLFTYGHLSQCYDATSGLVRDRARWPVQDFAAVQNIGTFALATAIAWNLGYVDYASAKTIITKTKNTLLNITRHKKGLLPHYLKNGSIVKDTEWSSVDTVITLFGEILACQAMGENTSQLEAMITNIDWNDLTDNGAHSISMGYDYAGNKLASRWDIFGAESLLMAIAYSAATGKTNVKLDHFKTPPSWDGSGFNDELATLFFPAIGIDIWGNDWLTYRQTAFNKQWQYFSASNYATFGLFGLSASEVPEPWTVAEKKVYGAWGVGGHNGWANDGTALVGYPIIAPHYAAMIASEHKEVFEKMFLYLIDTIKIFTPLNNVESLGLDSSGTLHWNPLKGSWNLSLQGLGAGRALSAGNYLAYQALSKNKYLNDGFNKIITISSPTISLSRSSINFGGTPSVSPAAVDIYVENSGAGTLQWTATTNQSWLQTTPANGIGAGAVSVSIDTTGLAPGSYQGVVTITDPNATNSPQSVSVNLVVYANGSSSIPFGDFATPLDGSSVSSSIPVTGWVLDDIGVASVKLYREEAGNLIYIGDALLVEGARPDVELAYPTYPSNNKAGWGYMLLTNFLPNNGNGTFKIHVIAVDMEGFEASLGSKTIICDNAHAVNPFGAIDTPSPGGVASGSRFVNWGWVLTPQPNSIPTNASTIHVYVDGINLGHPTYNIYRADIATLFPGYANSNNAIGYFYLDTTPYPNGVHTIQWTAQDSAGNSDGIGSRYFTVRNTANPRANTGTEKLSQPTASAATTAIPLKTLESPYIEYLMRADNKFKSLVENRDGTYDLEMTELESIAIQLSNHATVVAGYSMVGNYLRPLPPGLTVDPKNGKFYWQPGPGFVGDYRFVFMIKDSHNQVSKKIINVTMVPKFSPRVQ